MSLPLSDVPSMPVSEGYLTLFHSPERTYNVAGGSNLFKSDSPKASLFQMDETAQEF